jgi:hypothetical protein
VGVDEAQAETLTEPPAQARQQVQLLEVPPLE